MCGICGIVRSDSAAVERAPLEQMNAAITHRGPDSDGFYFAPGVGLAMRRLAIIDLQTGDQPIPNEDETVWVIQNGEIYNFPELRTELESRGHRFRTQSDTECIVHLYEEYGHDCVNTCAACLPLPFGTRARIDCCLAGTGWAKNRFITPFKTDTLFQFRASQPAQRVA